MKGQTAVEYLMTYGWAILIILIVAGVLAYYGIFAPSGFLGPSARGFGNIAVISPWDLTTAEVLKLQIENRAGQEITITNVYVDSSPNSPTTACTGIPVGGTSYAAAQKAYLPDLTCTGAATGTPSVSDTYSIGVAIEYSVGTATGLKSTGTVTGTFS